MQERVIIVIVATAIGLLRFGDAIDPRQTGPRRELTKGFAVDLDAGNKSGGALISDRENNDFAVDRENIHDIKTVHVPASSGSVESVTETGGRTSDFVELVRRSVIGEQSVTLGPATEEPPSSSPEQEVCDKQGGDLCLDTKYNIKGTCCSPFTCTKQTERSSLCKAENLAAGDACFSATTGSLGSCAGPLICLNAICTQPSARCIDPVNGLCYSSDLQLTVGTCCAGSSCLPITGATDFFCQASLSPGSDCNTTEHRGICSGGFCDGGICKTGESTTTTSTTTTTTTTAATTTTTTTTKIMLGPNTTTGRTTTLGSTTIRSTTPPKASEEETDKDCGDDEICLKREDCPSFLEEYERFKSLNKGLEKSNLRRELRNSVCNKGEKSVCCPNSESGQYYNVTKDGFINCQTREDCPPNFETSNYDSFSYRCRQGRGTFATLFPTDETWIGDICEEESVRGITCGNGKRAKDCGDCGTTEEECRSGDCGYAYLGPSLPFCWASTGGGCPSCQPLSPGSPLTWSSAIGGTGISSATNPDSYDECGPLYCRRGNKCCLLVNIGWSNRYLGCPQYC